MRRIEDWRRKWDATAEESLILVPLGETLLQIQSSACREDDVEVYHHEGHYLVLSLSDEEPIAGDEDEDPYMIAYLEVYGDDGEPLGIVEGDSVESYELMPSTASFLWNAWKEANA